MEVQYDVVSIILGGLLAKVVREQTTLAQLEVSPCWIFNQEKSLFDIFYNSEKLLWNCFASVKDNWPVWGLNP